MEKTQRRAAMRTFAKQYLAGHSRAFAAAAVCAALFFISFALYRLPLAAVAYPCALCAALWALWLWWDMRRAFLRAEAMRRITTAQDFVAMAAKPQAQGPVEAAALALAERLAADWQAGRTDAERRWTDMTDYYTMWAHQIKIPIAAMQLTLAEQDDETARKARQSLVRLEQYVEMALAFLRLEAHDGAEGAGRGGFGADMVIRPCRLDDVIRAAVRRFAGEFITRRLTLAYQPTDAIVLTDEKWLAFVLEQLLSNALKYTRSGGVTIDWSAPDTLCIADTGIGIDGQDLPRIFEKGYTGYNGRADKRASGIGLYLCRRILSALGHGVRVESTVGQGTRVSLIFAAPASNDALQNC